MTIAQAFRWSVRGWVGVVLLIFTLTPASAREPWPSVRVQSSPGDAKVIAALEEPTDFEFVETPLRDVVEFLKDLHKIEIQIDVRSLDDVGIGTETPVSRTLKGVPLASALDEILFGMELEYFVRGGMLIVTTTESDRANSEVRIYNLAELSPEHATTANIVDAIKGALPDPPVIVTSDDPSYMPEQRATSYTQLGKLLLVRGSLVKHREIGNLLAAMHAAENGETDPQPAAEAGNDQPSAAAEPAPPQDAKPEESKPPASEEPKAASPEAK